MAGLVVRVGRVVVVMLVVVAVVLSVIWFWLLCCQKQIRLLTFVCTSRLSVFPQEFSNFSCGLMHLSSPLLEIDIIDVSLCLTERNGDRLMEIV